MSSPRSSRGPRYSHEQMEAILQRAIQKQSQAEEGVSHDELLAAAEEVGIPREDIEAAVEDLEAEAKPKVQAPQEIEAARDDATLRQARARRLFYTTALWFAVSGVLFTVSRHTGFHGFFVFSVIWGIMLMVRASNLLFPKPERLKRESKRQRRERERRERAEQSLQVFERKLAIGTDAIGHLIDRARGTAAPAQGWRPAQRRPGQRSSVAPSATPPVAVTAAPKTAKDAAPASTAAAAPAASSVPASSEARSRIDAGTFERFIASRARVVGAPVEDLDELDDEPEERAQLRRR